MSGEKLNAYYVSFGNEDTKKVRMRASKSLFGPYRSIIQ